MTDHQENEGESAKKESVKRFVIRITKPFELETQGLGRVLARRMTVKGSSTFFKRLKTLDGVADAKLVRVYMGCVSGLPLDDPEKLPAPLTEDQVALLTDEDVSSFANAYLTHIANVTDVGAPLPQMASFIRNERAQNIEDQKKLAATISSALKVSSTAEMMKQWEALNQSISGPVERLREEMAKVLGPAGAMRSSIADALKDLKGDRLSAFKASSGLPDAFRVPIEPPIYERLRLPEMPPVERTPIGRTAIAVEKLSQAGGRMEGAMNLVVEQAGNVSGQMGQVLGKIEEEAGKSQKAARIALLIGGLSLLVSAIALGASAIFSWLGYRADRTDARTGDQATAQVVRELHDQNAALRSVLDELRVQRQEAKDRAAQAAAKALVPASKGPAPTEVARGSAQGKKGR